MSEELRRPTLRDVAALAGVSIKTASRVVNEERFVSEAVSGRVQSAVRQLGYRRDHFASAMKRERGTGTIGLVVADVANPFFSEITRAVEQVALDAGYLLITVSSDEDARRERDIIDRLVQRRVDGLLIASARRDHRHLRREIDHGMAIVFFDRPPVRLSADAVLLDNEEGARQAVEHLLARGHRRVALLSDTPRDAFTAEERFAGYTAALGAAGVPLDDRLVRFGLHDPARTRLAVADLLTAAEPPSAFFATNNRTAVGVIEATAERPDVGLVGFDDFELAGALRRPVTVVAYDTSAIAVQAGELLLARLAGRRSRPEVRRIPTRLIVRAT